MSKTDKATFAVYRVGDIDADATPALRKALDAHRQQYGALPLGLVVSKPLVDKARAALTILGLPTLPVKGSGGCLAWEVWAKEAAQ